MARIVKVTNVDKEKRTKAEPFAAMLPLAWPWG